MDKGTLLLIAIASLALFVLPNTMSLFVGQHNFEDRAVCRKCHVGEHHELYQSQVNSTLAAHVRAAKNTNYTTYLAVGGIKYYSSNSTIAAIDGKVWTWNGSWDGGNGTWENGSERKLASLDFNNNNVIDEDELCHLCHNSSLFGFGKETHTAAVRVCDDDWCHGNRDHAYLTNATDLLFDPVNVSYVMTTGYNISRNNVHSPFYLNLSNVSSTYPTGNRFGNHVCGNANGTSISAGHWTCVGCHSEVAMDVTLVPSSTYNHSDANAPQRRY